MKRILSYGFDSTVAVLGIVGVVTTLGNVVVVLHPVCVATWNVIRVTSVSGCGWMYTDRWEASVEGSLVEKESCKRR